MSTNTEQADIAAIIGGEEARLRAFNERDIATLDTLLADDLVYTHSNGMREGKRAFLDRLETGISRFSRGRVLEASVQIHGDIGVFNGRFVLTLTTSDHVVDIDSRQLSVWRRAEGNRWQQFATASSPVRIETRPAS